MKLSIAALNGTPIMKYQTRNVIIAIEITIGTNTEAILSANFWIGAFEPCASSTYLIICAITVFFPTAVVLNVILPFKLIVPPVTLSFINLSTGMLSPEIIDSSIEEPPSVITPSTGIRSPGRTIIISPSATSSIFISVSLLFFIKWAVLGWRPISFFIAEVVFDFAPASSRRPIRIKVILTAAVSK